MGRNIGYKITFAIFILLVIGYGVFTFSPLLTGPHITVLYPDNRSVSDEPFIDIMLETNRVTDLLVQEQNVDIDSTGVTVYRQYLSKGNNTISIQGCDQYNTCKQLSLFVYKK